MNGRGLGEALAPSDTDKQLERAVRELVDRISARAAPYRNAKAPRSLDEPAMREFAHSSRTLPELIDALLLSQRHEDYFKYRFGYLLRLIEALDEIGDVTGAEKLHDVSRIDGAAGAKTGKQNQAAKAVVRWSDIAPKVIIRIVAAGWSKPKTQLAKRLRLNYPIDAPALPTSDRTLFRLIDKMRAAGEIKLDT